MLGQGVLTVVLVELKRDNEPVQTILLILLEMLQVVWVLVRKMKTVGIKNAVSFCSNIRLCIDDLLYFGYGYEYDCD